MDFEVGDLEKVFRCCWKDVVVEEWGRGKFSNSNLDSGNGGKILKTVKNFENEDSSVSFCSSNFCEF